MVLSLLKMRNYKYHHIADSFRLQQTTLRLLQPQSGSFLYLDFELYLLEISKTKRRIQGTNQPYGERNY